MRWCPACTLQPCLLLLSAHLLSTVPLSTHPPTQTQNPTTPHRPATIFFPVEIYRRVYKPSMRLVWVLEAVNVFSFIVTLLAVVGSVQSIIVDASSYSFFS